MDGYTVKIEELGALITDLDTAADRMTDANRKLAGGGAFGSLGSADLGRAGAEFEEAWGYGIERLGASATEITERLKQAKQRYERIEAEFGEQLDRFADGPVGGGYTGGVPGINDLAGEPGRIGGVPGVGSADGPVGGGYTGGVPGIGDLASPGARPVGGGYTGGVPGIGDLASPGARPVGGGYTGGVPGTGDLAEPGVHPVGGPADSGSASSGQEPPPDRPISDRLNGLDR